MCEASVGGLRTPVGPENRVYDTILDINIVFNRTLDTRVLQLVIELKVAPCFTLVAERLGSASGGRASNGFFPHDLICLRSP